MSPQAMHDLFFVETFVVKSIDRTLLASFHLNLFEIVKHFL